MKVDTVVKSTSGKDDKSKNYIVTVTVEGCDSYDLSRSTAEFEKLLSNLKNCYPEVYSQFKIPQKKVFQSSVDVVKSKCLVFSDILSKATSNSSHLEEKTVRNFLNLTDALSTQSQSDENLLNLDGKQNNKAKPSDFDFMKVIGKGSFGQVYLAHHKTEGKYYAIKVLQKHFILKRNETHHIMSEKSILVKNCSHPFLVKLHYTFQTKEKLYFVLSYVNGGELFYHLQREGSFSESRVRFYAAEIGLALSHLHNMNIIYRDLKPENLLLGSDGHIVLTDFGLSKNDVGIDQKTNTFCGTPEYLAPEIIRKEPHNKSVDWWCFGCVIYELMFGLPPFYNRNVTEMYTAIVMQPLKFQGKVSNPTKHLLNGLLNKNASERLGSSAEDFNEIKTHEFFVSIDWEALYNKKVVPPFIPTVTSESDTTNVDVEFTRETVPDSVVPQEVNRAGDYHDSEFLGFTYVSNLE